MSSFWIFMLFFTAVNVSEAAWTTNMPPSNNSIIGSYCHLQKGQYCRSCDNLVTCLNYRIINSIRCSSNCDAYENKCSNEAIPECTESRQPPPTCTGLGLFPDPYYCSRYYFCPGDTSNSLLFFCNYGQAFNVIYNECAWHDSNLITSYDTPCPVFPKCTHDFQIGTHPNNSRIYYVCLENENGELRHTVFKCPNGHVYNETGCEKP